ncbi:DUF1016 family protein [bacterium]|nr:DUF1016 family protein [bacterium]
MKIDKKALRNGFYQNIKEILESARIKSYHAVNFAMVEAYWNIGRLIVEEEQLGKEQAEYGTYVIKELSIKLTAEHGKGFDQSNLKRMRQFYLTFPIGAAVKHQLENGKSHALRDHSKNSQISAAVRHQLSWTHYKLLIRVSNETARNWYMNEAADCGWSTRQLERQINSLYYERLLASKDKKAVQQEAEGNIKRLMVQPVDLIKDPYILEFLGLNPDLTYLEKELEQGLLDKLQQFLLELGKGFCFVARQQRIATETSNFYVDLVFYNYLLKCFVLIDLKTGKLTHQDIGQMDMYVRLYEDKIKPAEDNPTIGLILCTEKEETVVKYSVLNESKQLFVSKYLLYLPSEQELIEEIEREKAFIQQEKQHQSRGKIEK